MLGYPDLPVWAIACRRPAPADSSRRRCRQSGVLGRTFFLWRQRV